MAFLECEARFSFMDKPVTVRLNVPEVLGKTREEIEIMEDGEIVDLLSKFIWEQKPQRFEIWPLFKGIPIKVCPPCREETKEEDIS